MESAIRGLHWRDFEILTDLVFRQAGWRRTSVLGQSMKDVDLELQESVTGDRYQVQVKSTASRQEFERAAREFPADAFRELYFVVHTPDSTLCSVEADLREDVELVGPQRLAGMVVDSGLVAWVIDRIR